MANALTAGKGAQWASMLQDKLYESFVGLNISNTKFEGEFSNGNATVHFPRLAKIVSNDLATSYTDVTVQDLTEADETFTLDTRKHFAFEVSLEDRIELRVDPESQAIVDGAEAFARDWDDSIMAQYANAGYVVDDGDLETATNGGAGNAAILSKTNAYDLFTAIDQVMDENNMPTENRFVVISPAEKRFLNKSPDLVRATDMGDQIVRKGYMGELLGIKVYVSNNLEVATGTRHLLAGQGKPVCFAANIKPQVMITPAEYRDNFADLIKAQTHFGSKVFSEGAERLIDVQVTA